MKFEKGKSKRIHQCLLTSCSEHFADIGIPVEFAAPAMYTLLSSAIGRKYYFYTHKGYASLNGFRLLVSGPGSGKSMAIRFAREVILASELKIPLAPASVTKSSFVDELASGACRVQMGLDGNDQVSALTILASEYGVYIGQHVNDDFYHTKCEIFDGAHYKETRRHLKDPVEIKAPYVNMLAGTQPTHWASAFPRQAWSLGYASRCDFYFSDVEDADVESFRPLPAPRVETSERVAPIIREFAHDLQYIVASVADDLAVPLTFSDEGWEAYRSWYTDEREFTEFKDPWLLDYNVRRGFRLWRDAGLCALARADHENKVEPQDVEKALSFFRPQEEQLVTYLHKMRHSDDADIAKSLHAWLVREYMKNTPKRPISKAVVVEFIGNKVDSIHKVDKVLEYVVSIGAVEQRDYIITQGGNKLPASMSYVPNLEWESST